LSYPQVLANQLQIQLQTKQSLLHSCGRNRNKRNAFQSLKEMRFN